MKDKAIKKIVQFSGEDRKEAIINHFCFDIVEEESFFEYIENMGYNIDEEDEIIHHLHSMWEKQQ